MTAKTALTSASKFAANLVLYLVKMAALVIALPAYAIGSLIISASRRDFSKSIAWMKEIVGTFDVIGSYKAGGDRLAVNIYNIIAPSLFAGLAIFFSDVNGAKTGTESYRTSMSTTKINTHYFMLLLRQKPYETPQKVLDAIPAAYELLVEQKLKRLDESAEKFAAEGLSETAGVYAQAAKDIRQKQEQRNLDRKYGKTVTEPGEELAQDCNGLNMEAIASRLVENLSKDFPYFEITRSQSVSVLTRKSSSLFSIPTERNQDSNALFKQLFSKEGQRLQELQQITPKPLTKEEALAALQEQVQKRDNQASVAPQISEPPSHYWRGIAESSKLGLEGWSRGKVA